MHTTRQQPLTDASVQHMIEVRQSRSHTIAQTPVVQPPIVQVPETQSRDDWLDAPPQHWLDAPSSQSVTHVTQAQGYIAPQAAPHLSGTVTNDVARTPTPPWGRGGKPPGQLRGRGGRGGRGGGGGGRQVKAAPVEATPVEVIDVNNIDVIDPQLLSQDQHTKHWANDEKKLLLNWLSDGLQNYQYWKNKLNKASKKVSKVVYQG
ncbi:hypothetical protein FPQ18DRAFT_329473 [Pyronema domesticum]|nr:hypothetical protein FPQ18DRAFT_329473 [Pyronema domesticum]